MGATEGSDEAVAVGSGNISEVFFKTSSIMMAVWCCDGTPGPVQQQLVLRDLWES